MRPIRLHAVTPQVQFLECRAQPSALPLHSAAVFESRPAPDRADRHVEFTALLNVKFDFTDSDAIRPQREFLDQHDPDERVEHRRILPLALPSANGSDSMPLMRAWNPVAPGPAGNHATSSSELEPAHPNESLAGRFIRFAGPAIVAWGGAYLAVPGDIEIAPTERHEAETPGACPAGPAGAETLPAEPLQPILDFVSSQTAGFRVDLDQLEQAARQLFTDLDALVAEVSSSEDQLETALWSVAAAFLGGAGSSLISERQRNFRSVSWEPF
jgi:hypothetical protein